MSTSLLTYLVRPLRPPLDTRESLVPEPEGFMTSALSRQKGIHHSAEDPQRIVDCDIHNVLPNLQSIEPYLSTRWRRQLQTFGFRTSHTNTFFSRAHKFSARRDAFPEANDLPPGSVLSLVQKQLLDAYNISYGVLNPTDHLQFGMQTSHEFSLALTHALNDWTIDCWLEPEPRLRASICVAFEAGDLAVGEIDRLAEDDRFVQIFINARTREPLGNRKYWKLFEAACHYDIPVALHVGGHGGNMITGAGLPTYYFEYHVDYAQAFQAQLISLIFEGVFEHFPNLHVVFVESGIGWIPSLGW